MDRQSRESVLHGVQQIREEGGGDAGDQPDDETLGERRGGEELVRPDGEVRPRAEQRNAERRGDRRRARNGNEAAGLPLEQEELDGEQHRGHRRGEDRRHARRRAEEIRSRISAISATTDAGTVTLELGGLQVGFNSSTRFQPDDGDGDGRAAPLSEGGDGGTALADFVAGVQADLAAGRHPAVRARRTPPSTPQAPDDATFLATELRLDQENDHPRIRLNVTSANLVTSPPPPDAVLKVLGLSIELRVSDGTTTLRAENPEVDDEQEFEGMVQSVDQTANTVTLADGSIIHIVSGTELEAREGGDDEHLGSLADVQAALTAGRSVEAEGEGLVTGANPLTIDAVKIEFEADEVAEQQS